MFLIINRNEWDEIIIKIIINNNVLCFKVIINYKGLFDTVLTYI